MTDPHELSTILAARVEKSKRLEAEDRMDTVLSCQWEAMRLQVVALEKGMLALAGELASAHECCPYYSDTDGEGCPCPEENYNRDQNGHCDKSDRRGRKGVECWRLWAMKRGSAE